jgi:cytochrome P450
VEGAANPFDRKLLFDHPDPYPLFQMLRQSQPVFETRHLDRPTFLLTTYDDCLAALKDAETYSSRSNAEAGQVLGRTVLEMDGREHGRHRALVQPAFVPKALDGLQPVLEEIVHELVEAIAREPRADLVADFTERYPVQVSAHMLGIPRADHPRYQRWAMELMGFTRDFARAEAASAEIRQYLLPILAARRTAPRDDIVTRLVHGSVEGEHLNDEDVVSFLRLLIPAGAETTFRLIGNMLVALLTERDRFERVRADRSLVPWAIEETLRWETSIVMLSRETTCPTSVRDVALPEGALVSVVLGSANRDEAHYERPDEYDLDRRADDHLAFGFGRHHCVGYHLARLEARVALTAILDRLPNLRLDPGAPAPAITGLAFRSPKRLDVVVG